MEVPSSEPTPVKESSCATTPKRRAYDVGFKLSVVAFAEQTSNRAAGRKHGIDEKRIREWRSLKSTFELDPRSKRKRLSGGGRKPLLATNTEHRLVEWVENLLLQGNGVEHSLIVAESRKQAVEENSQSTFIASKTWLDNFLKRHGFVSKKGIVIRKEDESASCSPRPDPSFQEIVSQIRGLQCKERFPFRTMGGVEEVVICVQTQAKPTNQQATLRICSSTCITVALGAAADGRKYLPFAVFREGDIAPSTNKKTGVIVNYSSDGQMTDQLLSDWVTHVWWNLHTDRRGILIWDSSTSTSTQCTMKLAKEEGTEIVFLPHVLISSLQPSLPSWGSIFKDNFDRQHFGHLTRQQIQHGCTQDMVLQWIQHAWNGISEEFILESLRARGIVFGEADRHREISTEDTRTNLDARTEESVRDFENTRQDNIVRQVEEATRSIPEVSRGNTEERDHNIEATRQDNSASQEGEAERSVVDDSTESSSQDSTIREMDVVLERLSSAAQDYNVVNEPALTSEDAVVQLQDCVHEVVIKLATDTVTSRTNPV